MIDAIPREMKTRIAPFAAESIERVEERRMLPGGPPWLIGADLVHRPDVDEATRLCRVRTTTIETVPVATPAVYIDGRTGADLTVEVEHAFDTYQFARHQPGDPFCETVGRVS